ncbi:metal ABC transporter permease [Nodosilinea sp. E11]|uniref:metal ABC transporter permease n=1 Tax=Nodosilinea sp. E11 TaxID=3037479 RepID=UPI0029345FB2|nr:metal ABC transporter permease [Nodosilinea sp. E11]WOD41598.1 metal ABC transporter permease [Nodosilinea sp. E11]
MEDALQLLTIPFLVALVLIGIHTYLGIHVLSRNVVFVDLALAQISALGATVAFMLGHMPQTPAAYGYSLVFTVAGAAILSLSRQWTGRVSQETFIGVVYVVSAAAAFLLIDRSPQGAEHIKQILVGSLLTTTEGDLLKVVGLYGAVGIFHWLFRDRFLTISLDPEQAVANGWRLWFWDFLFYVSFGVVVTSSVAIAGVLLVFSFLIIPAAVGTLYSTRVWAKLVLGWTVGLFTSAFGIGASYGWDLPTGATIVCAFGAMLAIATVLQPLILNPPEQRRRIFAQALRSLGLGGLGLALLSGLWLTVNPHADQPLLGLIEHYYPELQNRFLTDAERELAAEATFGEREMQTHIQQLTQLERDSRWQGDPLTEDRLRELSSYTLSYQEMEKGESFVQESLKDRARDRQRWVFGVPLIALALGGLLIVNQNQELPETQS